MKQSTMALAALAGGIGAGALVREIDSAVLTAAAGALRPLGTLWLNALKMTLVPLVFAMVARGMITIDRSGGGSRLLGITLPLLIGLLGVAMAIGMGFGLLFDALWPTMPGALSSIGGASVGVAAAPQSVAPLTELIVSLVPSNPIAAASNGAMASIVMFAIIFGFAVSRTTGPGGQALAHVVGGLADAMIRIVHWVLWFTPVGIFVLAMGLALDTGFAVAGVVAQMVIVCIAGALIAIACCYLLAWFGGGVPPTRFAAAIVGVQAMAAGTCSSAATLPAMLEASSEKLCIPEPIGGAVLPLAVSIFRFGVLMYQGALVILILHAYGLPLSPGQALVGGAIFILAQVGSAGLPGAAVIYASWSPPLQFLGVPLEIIPLMIAINSLPDIFITVGNVSGDMAVTTIVARLFRRSAAPLAAEPIAA